MSALTASPASRSALQVGRRVRSYRRARGLTGIEIRVATISPELPAGIHPGSLCAIEKGRREPSLPQLRALARVFKVTLDDLAWVGRRVAAAT